MRRAVPSIVAPSSRQFSTTLTCLRSLVNPGSHEISFPKTGKTPVVTDVKTALKPVKSGKNNFFFYESFLGDHIFVHGIAATPTPLLQALCEHVKEKNLKKITLHHLHLEGPTPWTEADVKGRFSVILKWF